MWSWHLGGVGMAGRGRGRPRGEDAGEVDRAILAAAHRLFMALGYRAVSTRQIAEAAGVTQPALYYHFAGKQDLYAAVLREELAQLSARMAAIAGDGASVAERLLQVVRALPVASEDMGQMFHDIDHELGPEARRSVELAFQQGVVVPIAAILKDGIARHLLRDPRHGGVDAHTAAYLLLSMVRQPPPRDEPRVDAEHRAATIVEVLLHGLAVPGIREGPSAESG